MKALIFVRYNTAPQESYGEVVDQLITEKDSVEEATEFVKNYELKSGELMIYYLIGKTK